MTIQLLDLDVSYDVSTDITADGKDVIRISPQSGREDRDSDYDICLDYDMCQQLIRTLQFISNEIKPNKE